MEISTENLALRGRANIEVYGSVDTNTVATIRVTLNRLRPQSGLMSVRATRRREQSFEAFARRVKDALGDAVQEIILYGSTARGEATETSDVDVLVVLEQTADGNPREVISTLAFEVGLEYDVAISYHIQSKERFETRQTAPFLKHVLQDGRFYG